MKPKLRTIVVGAPGEKSSAFTSAGNVYTFNAETGNLLSTYSSPNAQTSGNFGDSVGISGTTMVVGAPFETGVVSGFSQAGNTYTFDVTTASLLETVSSPNSIANGNFGISVGISGNTIVVGAPSETANSQPGAGNVYTFSATIGALKLGTFSSPNGRNNGFFGFAVAISGTTLSSAQIVVGAPDERASGLSDSGFAYEFRDLPLALSSPSPITNGFFGFYVAMNAKYIVVGAPQESVGLLTNAGHAYVVNTLTDKIVTLTSPNAETNGLFGFKVVISGSTVIVGVVQETVSLQSKAGRAYAFSASTGALLRTFTSTTPQADGVFGASVAILGSTAVVGAPGEIAGGKSQAGNAYSFNVNTGTLLKTFKSPTPQVSGIFGDALAIAATSLGTRIAIGAVGETSSGFAGAGNVYLFNAKTGTLAQTLTTPNPIANGGLGALSP